MAIPVRYPRKRPAAPETSPQKPEKPMLIEPLPAQIPPICTYGRGPHLTRVWNDASLLTKGQLSDARFLNALLLSGERGMTGPLLPATNLGINIGSTTKYINFIYCWHLVGYGGEVKVSGFLDPSQTNTHDVGTASLRWRKGYFYTVDVLDILTNTIHERTVDAGVTVDGVLCKDGTVTPTNGASGTFTTADGKTVTVTNGIITSIV